MFSTILPPAIRPLFRTMLLLPQLLDLFVAKTSIDDLLAVDEWFRTAWIAAFSSLVM